MYHYNWRDECSQLLLHYCLQNEVHTNELLAAACAVGVSSNFAAPIGGIIVYQYCMGSINTHIHCTLYCIA